MISYNPKDWFKLITAFHKSDTFRRLIPAMIGIGAFTAIIVSFEIYVWHWAFKNISIIHSILGFILTVLLVFRTNTAYDRWWEGRKLWGDLVNNSRNLTIKIINLIEDRMHKKEIINLIINYNFVLKNHLRQKVQTNNFYDLPEDLKTTILKAGHSPNIIANKLFEKVNLLHQNKKINDIQLLMLNDEVKSFTNICGACERIKNTPIPHSYNLFLKKIIFLYVFTIPFAFGPEFRYATIIISIIVLYVFASIELIAEEIEDPFGDDDNDLPLETICYNIKNNLTELLENDRK